MKKSNHTSVLIVGAGPTGLTMAAQLAQHGIAFRIIDKKEGLTTKSKALGVQGRTLELLESMGLAEKALELGNRVNGANILIKGKKAATLDISGIEGLDGPYAFLLILEQSKTEKILYDYIQNAGLDVEWQTELLDFSQNEQGVKATIRHADGSEETVSANWLIGADGASSPVRHILNLPFKGGTYEQRFLLADVQLEWELEHDQLYLSFSNDGFTGFFPMFGEGRYRIIGSFPRNYKGDYEKVDFEEVKAIIHQLAHIPLKMSNERWYSVYKLHHRAAEQFRVARAFLLGDAAHVHSPAGGQGMNTGIQDAYNLAWKIAMVEKGMANSEFLDTYQQERYPIAQKLLNGTDAAFQMLVHPNPLVLFFRNHIFPKVANFITRNEKIRRRVFRIVSQIAIRYRNSSIVEEHNPKQLFHRKAPKAGDRAPYGIVQNADNERLSLYKVIGGSSHQLLLFTGKNSTTEEMDKLVEMRQYVKENLGNWINCFVIQVNGNEIKEFENVYIDPENALHELYGSQQATCYLVRPDGYIAFRSQPLDLAALKQYWGRFFGG